MPVTLKLRFPAGRYHATPWGRHVNEGVAEWPPSPWRLLRALVAVWKRTCPDVPEAQVRRVLETLARPPLFRLPAHRVAHTRHYMPWEKKGPADRTLVFDTFVAVGREDWLHVHWPAVALAVEDEACLGRLASRLTSLGRAEGWVEAELVPFPEDGPPVRWNCEPAEGPGEGEFVPVLCPDPATAFGDDHYPKKLRKGERLFDCPRWHLCLDTETVHAEKWPRVPGARWVNYVLRKPDPLPRRSPPPNRNRPTVARFLLDGPVLPLATDTVRVAEAVRAAAMGRFRRWCEKHPAEADRFLRPTGRYSSPILSGKDGAGQFLRTHGHAHYLPTAEGDDPRRVTHVTVWAPGGFGPGETAALISLREVTLGETKVRVQLVGLGHPTHFTADLFRPSRVWVSATPFVAHRHLKRRGAKRDTLPETDDPRAAFLELTARELVERRGLGRLVSATAMMDVRTPAREFRRSRNRAGDDGWQRASGFVRLEFETEVAGPLCLGYASHYGLGLFRPEA